MKASQGNLHSGNNIRNSQFVTLIFQFFLYFCLLFNDCKSTEISGISDPIVQVKQGKLKGSVEENIDGGQYLLFSGIPYAQPPVGELRFKDPLPPKPWMGILDASKESMKAIQFDEFSNELIGEEDCLYLHVAVNNFSKQKSVMVWIHGGGFTFGSGDRNFYSPDYLLKHDIVFVSINYRLGIFGFLNMDTEDCPGNQGLKDQVLALKWIQENIEAFGGDKNNVTIFGQSSGSASVHYHCLSPESKGLFHKAIIQSGVVANPWAFQRSNKEKGFKIANALGKDSSNSEEIVDFLRSVNPQDILRVQQKLYPKDSFMLEFIFIPTIDSKSAKPFLTKHPSELMKNEINFPLMIGFNSKEGITSLEDSYLIDVGREINAGEKESWYTKLNDNFDEILAFDLKRDINEVSNFSGDVRNFYFTDKVITQKEREAFVRYRGDVNIVIGTQYIIERQMSKIGFPTYVYRFSLNVEHLLKIIRKIDIEGAAHTDELSLLFFFPFLGKDRVLKKNTVDYLVMKRLTKMWTNFAKTGNPTPEIDDLITEKWLSLKKDRKFYIDISDSLEMKENPENESWKFWKPLINQYHLI